MSERSVLSARATRSRHRFAHMHSDAGLTLVELLMAVAILGIAFTVLVGGMFTYVRTSAQHQTQANVGLYAAQYAEAVANNGYAPTCPSTYAATGYLPPTGYTATNTVAFWDEASATFGATCVPGDGRLQRVRTVVTYTGGYATTVDVVKRAP